MVGCEGVEQRADTAPGAFVGSLASLSHEFFELANTCSMGFRSGLYGGSNSSLAPTARILALAQASRDIAPWDRRTHRYRQVVFPQMASWLPADEADALRRQFSLELDRIAPLLDAA